MHPGLTTSVQNRAQPTWTSTTNLKRRAFLKACGVAAAAAGLDTELAAKVAHAVSAPDRPPVVWLHFQECTGCTETLLRTSKPAVQELILELISLDYHETLAAAAGHQLEANLHKVLEEHAGSFILVVEGAIPTKDGGIYCKVGGRTAAQSLEE
ncbi:MAG: twin-arginine translocation signal domain-containing protein, partial [Planctomycetes bacterium]|nr:twin-arginine translocation signal domain-containing protein [Planctomycetota bacterium]